MANFTYSPPRELAGPSYFGGSIPSLDRLRTLLILAGHGSIHGNGTSVKLKNDFMSVPAQVAGSFKVGKLLSKIPGCTSAQLRSLLTKAATKNIAIHENISRELIHCLAHYESGYFIASFVHLYRLIEHAALYLPLVTIISRGVNSFTFVQYKEVIDNKAKADLSVLKKFSSNILDQSLARSIARYSFSGTAMPAANVQVVTNILNGGEISSSGSDYVEVQYGSTDRLIVGFRNHFFHYLYHEKNISLRDLQDPDEFLKACLPNFLTYFAFLYRELLIAEWELWAR